VRNDVFKILAKIDEFSNFGKNEDFSKINLNLVKFEDFSNFGKI